MIFPQDIYARLEALESAQRAPVLDGPVIDVAGAARQDYPKGIEMTQSGATEDLEEARRLFDYSPESGRLTWRVRRAGVQIGAVAGTIGRHGYVRVPFRGKRHNGHRLCWLHYYGEWPTQPIDHINGVKDDNRIKNLRESTRSQNMHNRATRRQNVYWDEAGKWWRVSIRVDGRSLFYGKFKDEAEAKRVFTFQAPAT